MIHYHGGPMTPTTVAFRVWRGRHAMVSFHRPEQLPLAASICQSFALDNGAFSAWRQGEPITDWTRFHEWCAQWLPHPGCDFALIPDVIDGAEADNDALIDAWPHGERGVPVWHLHESIGRLIKLSRSWPRVALGSSGIYADIGTDLWWKRMGEAMSATTGEDDYPITKLHGLRMLNPKVFGRLPFASADSTNVARNVGLDTKWDGPYLPRSKETRGQVLAEAIDACNSAPMWRELTQGNHDWIERALEACDRVVNEP